MGRYHSDKIVVGVVQMTPVFFDNVATLKKIEGYIRKISEKKCKLVLFPESVLPGYPRGFDFGVTVGNRADWGRSLWEKYYDHSVEQGDKLCRTLTGFAKQYSVDIAIGVTEKTTQDTTLYCSIFFFTVDGGLCHVHRKIKPTGAERVVWGEGDGTSIKSVETAAGRTGGLICWENYMPLARMKLYRSGIDIYLAPTADARASWTASMQHIACESRSFVLSCNQFFKIDNYPSELIGYLGKDQPEVLSAGGSCIVSPFGKILGGPLWNQEGMVLAEIDLKEIIRSRMDFDPVGHYSRDGLFDHDTELKKNNW